MPFPLHETSGFPRMQAALSAVVDIHVTMRNQIIQVHAKGRGGVESPHTQDAGNELKVTRSAPRASGDLLEQAPTSASACLMETLVESTWTNVLPALSLNRL